ncbi:hypothetical protein HBI47_070950 [Parastagonospora nodorum]|nr:hypothetical protein HBI47_070950 [Parastagonospora nodorum]
MQQTNKYHIMYPMRLCTATLLQGHLPRTSLTSTKSKSHVMQFIQRLQVGKLTLTIEPVVHVHTQTIHLLIDEFADLLSRHVNGQWNVDFRAAMKLVKGSGRKDTGESCRKSVAMVREAHCALRVWGCLSW